MNSLVDIYNRLPPPLPFRWLPTRLLYVASFVSLSHRVDRLLRSSPQLLVQPAMMVQRRLTALRAVLNLPLTPQEEKVQGIGWLFRNTSVVLRMQRPEHHPTTEGLFILTSTEACCHRDIGECDGSSAPILSRSD